MYRMPVPHFDEKQGPLSTSEREWSDGTHLYYRPKGGTPNGFALVFLITSSFKTFTQSWTMELSDHSQST